MVQGAALPHARTKSATTRGRFGRGWIGRLAAAVERPASHSPPPIAAPEPRERRPGEKTATLLLWAALSIAAWAIWSRSGSGSIGLWSNFDNAQQRTNLSVADMATEPPPAEDGDLQAEKGS